MNKKCKKIIATSLIGTTLFTTLLPLVSFADSNPHQTGIESYILDEQRLKDIDEIAAYFGFTEQEKTDYINAIKEVKLEAQSTPTTRGKLSWAVKILKIAWKKIPKPVKAAIGGYEAFGHILSVLNTFTGTVEDGLYKGCKSLGMSNDVAWWVTKALLAFTL
ncbi:hypothetical protein QIW52_14780 [Clostridioides difficile]|nr:hypothetical protein [Clostridioides difficile]